MLQSKFKIGADASAAAGPVGRNAAAATDISLRSELLTYSRARGVFAGVDLNGADVSQNEDDTAKFYGANAKSYKEILQGDAATPAPAKRFVSTVSQYFKASRQR